MTVLYLDAEKYAIYLSIIHPSAIMEGWAGVSATSLYTYIETYINPISPTILAVDRLAETRIQPQCSARIIDARKEKYLS